MNEVEELFGEFHPKHLDWLSLYNPKKNMQNQMSIHKEKMESFFLFPNSDKIKVKKEMK